jgi:hypothetical protein
MKCILYENTESGEKFSCKVYIVSFWDGIFLQDTDAMVGKGADSLIIQSKFNCADDTVDTTQVQILSPYEVPYR